jgi:hypothetical protein
VAAWPDGVRAVGALRITFGRYRRPGGAGNRRPDTPWRRRKSPAGQRDETMAIHAAALNVPGKIREHSPGFKPGRGLEKGSSRCQELRAGIRGGGLRSE